MARALATDPAVLLLDELSMGLAPIVVAELYEIVAQLAAGGVSILVVEQFARAVLGVADRAAIVAARSCHHGGAARRHRSRAHQRIPGRSRGATMTDTNTSSTDDHTAGTATAAVAAVPATDAAAPAGDRMARFTAEVADLRLKTGRTRAEHLLQLVGLVLMVGGILLAAGGYAASLEVAATPGSNVDVLNSNSHQALGLVGIATSVVGGFVFLRYSLAQFLRFWLLRQAYEQQRAVDAASRPD